MQNRSELAETYDFSVCFPQRRRGHRRCGRPRGHRRRRFRRYCNILTGVARFYWYRAIRMAGAQDIDSDWHVRDLLPTDDLIDNLTFDWSHDPDTFTGRRLEFTSTSKQIFEVNDTTRLIDVFTKFFDNDFLDIAHQTNWHVTFLIDLTESSRLNP